MSVTVLFSWQSDRPSRECRNFIEKALEAAVANISNDLTVDEPSRPPLSVDKDTAGVSGSPPIFQTILEKIERAAAFVCDVTFVAERPNGHPTPNPNVLIEYGYALKAVALHRIIQVMNTAYGEPNRETMPFDMAHNRFPIRYHVAENASDDELNAALAELAKTLEFEIRAVLNSDAYKASLPKAPVPPPVKCREPREGKARFREKGQPLGYGQNIYNQMIGVGKPEPITLIGGPAVWLRLFPAIPPNEMSLSDLGKKFEAIRLMPINDAGDSIRIRAEDGYGNCSVLEGTAIAVSFVFTDGEIWSISTWSLQYTPKLISIDERWFSGNLLKFAEFLEQLGFKGPYRWIAGFEGVEGRALPVNNPFSPTRGACVSDVVEQEGTFDVGQDPIQAVEPLFQKVCALCDVKRPSRSPTTK